MERFAQRDALAEWLHRGGIGYSREVQHRHIAELRKVQGYVGDQQIDAPAALAEKHQSISGFGANYVVALTAQGCSQEVTHEHILNHQNHTGILVVWAAALEIGSW